MMRTVVCKKDGCIGNGFYISMEEGKLKVVCTECGSVYKYDINFYDYTILSQCSKCHGDVFKIYRDSESGKIYAKCIKCGEPPEKVYIDDEGMQVTYEEKLLQDIKQLMQRIEQRVSNVEMKVESLEKGQELLEESLAYINKYMNN